METEVIPPAAETAAPAADQAAAPFRFSAASALSPARRANLEGRHRQFLRAASDKLTDLLRFEVLLELDTVEVQTCAQLIEKRGEDHQGLLFRMPPQPGAWLLDLPSSLSLLIVDRLMGGHGVAPEKKVELTELEQVIFQQFAEVLLAEYAQNWLPDAALHPEVVRSVRLVREPRHLSHEAEDLLLEVRLHASLKGEKSTLAIFMPIAAAEDLLLPSGFEAAGGKANPPALIKDQKSPIATVPMSVAVRWQGFQISLREVASLAPGDLLLLDNKLCENASIWLGNRARFSGRLLREPSKTTITISKNLE